MKKSSRVILVLLTLICMAFGLAACGDKVSSIEVGTAPRVKFVQGLDLDLTGGTLTVNYEKKTEQIALDAEGVSVTGYDKNKIGEQTLTVTYQEFTTELKVTVVERMIVENATKDYFVGDEFDASKGKLTVRADDTTETTVNLNADGVTVTGFDSAEAGEKTVTVSYGGYSVPLTVKVHTPQIKFHKPNKTSYDSHETELSLLGGYFTLYSENKELERSVVLTADMVSGFDPTKATMEENVDTPLKQKVTVTYADYDYVDEYTVSIRYSDVTYFKTVAAEIKAENIQWSWETEIKTNWDTSYEALCRYLDMSSKERSYLTQEEIDLVIRPGVFYAWSAWTRAKDAYKDVLLVQNGNVAIVATEYESVREAYDKLVLKTDPFVLIGMDMMEFAEEFGDFVLLDELTVQKLVDGGYNFESFDEVLIRLNFMLELYECLKDVPEEWTYEDLKAQSVKIDNAKRMITTGGYNDMRSMFSIVGTWRADFYNILYSYYYETYLEASEKEEPDTATANASVSAIYALMEVYLPGPLEELYSYLNSAFQQAQYLKQNAMYDASYLFYNYYNILKIVEKVEAMEDDIYAVLYHQCGLKSMVYNYALNVNSEYGYGILAMSGGWYADEEVEGVWAKSNDMFDTLIKEMEEFRFVTFSEFAVKYKTKIVALFNSYAGLSPARQLGFVSSLHSKYLETVVDPEIDTPSVFEYTYNPDAPTIALQQNQFVNFIANMGYDYYFGDTAGKQVFHNLLQATEYYARAQAIPSEMAKFYAKMEAAMEERKKITDATELATFNELIGDLYAKYVKLYNQAKAETKPSLSTEMQAKFDGVVLAVGKVYAYYDLVSASLKAGTFNPELCGLVNGAYGKAQQIVAEILAGGEDVVNAYYHLPYKVGQNEEGADVYMTLDYFMATARSRFVSSNAIFHVSYTPFVEAYLDSTIQSIFVEVNDVLIDTYLSDEVSFTAADKAAVEATMQKIWAIDHSEWYIFNTIGGAYYDGLYAYFKDLVSTDALTVAEKLMNVETAYRTYLTYKDNPNAAYEDGTKPFEYFKNKLDEVTALYDVLSETDKGYLKLFYEHYQALAYPAQNA